MTASDPAVQPLRPGVSGRVRSVGARIKSSAALRKLGELDLRSTWQVAAGAVLLPLGVVIIMLGWYGAAHTPYVQQQIPYVVSGAFVGLGFMVAGGFLFWAHWTYRVYD